MKIFFNLLISLILFSSCKKGNEEIVVDMRSKSGERVEYMTDFMNAVSLQTYLNCVSKYIVDYEVFFEELQLFKGNYMLIYVSKTDYELIVNPGVAYPTIYTIKNNKLYEINTRIPIVVKRDEYDYCAEIEERGLIPNSGNVSNELVE